jgi:hypothetical protein
LRKDPYYRFLLSLIIPQSMPSVGRHSVTFDNLRTVAKGSRHQNDGEIRFDLCA